MANSEHLEILKRSVKEWNQWRKDNPDVKPDLERVDLSDADLARLLGSKGRHGDTLVAHISPLEAAILRLLGGSGTINPKTGLPEFWGLGGGASSGGHGDTGDGTGGAASGSKSGGNGGRGNENSAAGSRNASQRDSSYGGGYSDRATSNGRGNENSATGLTRGTTEARDTSYGGFGSLSGGQGSDALAGDWGQDFMDALSILGDTAWGAIKGIGGGPIGMGLGAAEGGYQSMREHNAFGMFGDKNTASSASQGRGYSAGASGGPYGGIGPNGGGDTRDGDYGGGGSGGTRNGGGRGDSGGLPANHTSIAQSAQQANVGGGLLAVLNPAAPISTPANQTLPVGLLQYLAQNPGLLQGLVANTRFGTGSVAPISYGQPLA